MKKTLLIFCSLLLCDISSFSQKPESSDFFTLKLESSIVNGEPLKFNNQIIQVRLRPQFGLSFQYEWLTDFKAGIYVAYANNTYVISNSSYNEIEVTYNTTQDPTISNALYYGINASWNIIPLLTNSNRIRFDFYPLISAGFVNENWKGIDSDLSGNSSFTELGGGFGVAYHFSPKFGIFTEGMYGRFFHEGKTRFKGGLVFRF
jgi:hypothetical protein